MIFIRRVNINQQILSDKEKLARTMAYEITRYGLAISNPDWSYEVLHREVVSVDYFCRARILAHYQSNGFFLEDNYLRDHIHQLERIPTVLVHGTEDAITSHQFAKEFCTSSPHIRMISVEGGGHSAKDPTIHKELIREVKSMIS